MKKITFVFLFAVFLFAGNAFSQTAPLSKGQKQLNFGIGLEEAGFPIYAGLDIAVHKDITIGPEVYLKLEDNSNSFGVAFRADYHFNSLLSIPKEFDFYAGANINHFFNDNYDHPTNLDFQIGGRWYWSKWGLNLELGGGRYNRGGKFGLSLKL